MFFAIKFKMKNYLPAILCKTLLGSFLSTDCFVPEISRSELIELQTARPAAISMMARNPLTNDSEMAR